LTCEDVVVERLNEIRNDTIHQRLEFERVHSARGPVRLVSSSRSYIFTRPF
jgi:hypothetical protein